MTKIKFRAWDKKSKKMGNTGILCEYLENPDLMQLSEVGRNYKLIQFTGLKDENGKEIYEGDILDWCDGECKLLIKINKSPLSTDYEILSQRDKNVVSHDIRLYRSDECSKIIGNIYTENPRNVKEGK